MTVSPLNTSIMSRLGMDQAKDPNTVPDGKYDGEITQSEYVVLPNSGKIKHAITYRVTDGDAKGASKQEWFEIGVDCVQADGTPATDLTNLANFTPSQTEKNRDWYHKRFKDLGFSDEEIPTLDVSRLVGLKVTFGVKRNDQGYQNVNFAELRQGATTGTQAPVALLQQSAPVGLAPVEQPAAGPAVNLSTL